MATMFSNRNYKDDVNGMDTEEIENEYPEVDSDDVYKLGFDKIISLQGVLLLFLDD
jgi:hypothetical protein